MNQLMTVDTRFGASVALFNTIHNRLISVMCDQEDITASLQQWERDSIASNLTNGYGFKRSFSAARVVATGFGTFVFPLHGRDCESRRFEMALQIASWMAETRPHQDVSYQVSAANRAVMNSERYKDVEYVAGFDTFQIKRNGEVMARSRLKTDIIILEGK